jgi:predicted transcriptional regulator
MTQEEKVKDLEQRLALMDADNSALAVELAHYKKVAAGLKGRNKQLAEQVEHYKNLDLEGDHLYEDVITELDKAKKEINQLLKQSCDVVPKKDYEEL